MRRFTGFPLTTALHDRRRLLGALCLTSTATLLGLSGCAAWEPAEKRGPSAQSSGAAIARTPKSLPKRSERPESHESPAASDPIRAGGQVLFARLPALSLAPSMTLEQQISVRFLEKARAAGAPASLPTLRAMVLASPDRVLAVFSAMGLTVWRLEASPAGITEWRSDKMGKELQAQNFLRDFMFVFWSAAALRAALAPGAALVEDDAPGRRERVLTVDGRRALRAVTTRRDHRAITTVENTLEGYVLTIETLR